MQGSDSGTKKWNGPQNRLSLSAKAWRSLRSVYADQIGAAPLAQRMAYRFMGGYLSMLEGMQKSSVKAAAGSAKPPLFIVGHWRSGTTFLHELMACDPQFCFPSTYACMNPQHFLLTERGAQKLSGDVEVARPMDSMKISSASPQEDEFALLCLGARSPYEAVLFPKALRRALESGDVTTLGQAEQAAWKTAIATFVAQAGSRHPGRTQLLKSPPHGWRIDLLRELFPGARFVHIVRNPFDVAASTRRMWEQLFNIYALSPPPYPDVLPDVAEFLSQLMARTEQQMQKADDGCVLRFEDLVAEPHRELEKIYGAFQLGDYEKVRPLFAAQLEKTAGHQKNKLVLSQADRDHILRWCRPVLERYGYKI